MTIKGLAILGGLLLSSTAYADEVRISSVHNSISVDIIDTVESDEYAVSYYDGATTSTAEVKTSTGDDLSFRIRGLRLEGGEMTVNIDRENGPTTRHNVEIPDIINEVISKSMKAAVFSEVPEDRLDQFLADFRRVLARSERTQSENDVIEIEDAKIDIPE